MEKKLMKKPRIILSALQQADKLSFFSYVPTNSCLSLSSELISSEGHILPLTAQSYSFLSMDDSLFFRKSKRFIII